MVCRMSERRPRSTTFFEQVGPSGFSPAKVPPEFCNILCAVLPFAYNPKIFFFFSPSQMCLFCFFVFIPFPPRDLAEFCSRTFFFEICLGGLKAKNYVLFGRIYGPTLRGPSTAIRLVALVPQQADVAGLAVESAHHRGKLFEFFFSDVRTTARGCFPPTFLLSPPMAAAALSVVGTSFFWLDGRPCSGGVPRPPRLFNTFLVFCVR